MQKRKNSKKLPQKKITLKTQEKKLVKSKVSKIMRGNRKSETPLLDPATLSMISTGATVVGATIAVIGYFSEQSQNRRISDDLRTISSYLKEINDKLGSIDERTKEILHKLDELPQRIRVIVTEVVREAELDVQYNTLATVQADFNEITRDDFRNYRMNSDRWFEFHKSLRYVFTHENRLSKMFGLFNYSELAWFVSKKKATALLLDLVKMKRNLIDKLHLEVYSTCKQELNALLLLLENKSYVVSHNLRANLSDFGNFRYDVVANMRTEEIYREYRCITIFRPRDVDFERCEWVDSTRYFPEGSRFNDDKAAHARSIDDKKLVVEELLKNYKSLKEAVKAFDDYYEMLKKKYRKNRDDNFELIKTSGGSSGKFFIVQN